MDDVTRHDLERLRCELRDVRYMVEGVLLAIGGERLRRDAPLDARLKSAAERERRGTPLRDVGIRYPAYDRLTSQYHCGLDIQTLEELMRFPRSTVAAIDGVGAKTMEQLDAAVAERGLTWADAAEEASDGAKLRLVAS